MNRDRRVISGAMAIRLSILFVVLVVAVVVLSGERRARYLYTHVYDEVLAKKAADSTAVQEIIGREPTETEVHGKLYIEKYVFKSPLGRKYVYYAVFQNGTDPRTLIHQYRDELPYWLTAKKPEVKTYDSLQRPPGEQDVERLDED